MKKFIITSACTLVLSLIGAFGSNQNTFNFNHLLNTTSSTNAVERYASSDTLQGLTSDNKTNVTAPVTEATNIENNVVTPDNGVYATATKPATGVLSATINYMPKNAQVIIYKKVNLSKCNSIKDVVATLQKQGYRNITKNNIYKIKSLKNILALIKANNVIGKVTTTPTSTPTTPAPTSTPTTSTTPSPTTAPTPTMSPVSNNTGINSYAGEVLRLINIERAKAGLSALTTNSTITSAANKRAQETKQSFSHTRPNGTGFSTVLTEYGITFRAAGENIAYGQKTPQEVVTAWMNSPGHRANILNTSFNKIGIGVYQSNGVIYWTQEFTN